MRPYNEAYDAGAVPIFPPLSPGDEVAFPKPDANDKKTRKKKKDISDDKDDDDDEDDDQKREKRESTRASKAKSSRGTTTAKGKGATVEKSVAKRTKRKS